MLLSGSHANTGSVSQSSLFQPCMAAPAALLHTGACAAEQFHPAVWEGFPRTAAVFGISIAAGGASGCASPLFVYPIGARSASATHGRFRKLRSESADNKILKPWFWYSSPPLTLGSEQHGSQQQNCQSSNCSEECSICAEIMGQNENQTLWTSISAYI